MRTRVVDKVADLLLEVLASRYRHVWAGVEGFFPARCISVTLAVVEDGQTRRNRQDAVPLRGQADAGVQHSPFGGREPIERHEPLVLASQLGSLRLPRT